MCQTEAASEMAASIVGLLAARWPPGDDFPTPAWRLSLRTNRFLLVAMALELAFAGAFVGVPACARLIEQKAPPAIAWIVIALSAPAIVLVDGLWKRTGGTRPPT